MQSLDLDIKYTVLINLNTGIFEDKLLADFLCICLYCKQLVQYILIFPKSRQLLQLCRILLPAISDQRRNIFCKRTITIHQPSAERNSVCLIIKFLRINLIKLMQLSVFQNFCVKCRNTIDRKSIMDIHMCHMNQLVAVDNSKIFLRILCFHLLVQSADNRNQLRHNILQILNRPFFQCFCQDCMIGIRTYMRNDLCCFFKCNSPLTKQTDKLWDNHTWMRIIDLNHCIISQIMEVASSGRCFIQNPLCCITYHKVLLINAKLPAILITVIRIQEQGQIVQNIFFIKRNSVMNHGFICQVNIKQVQTNCFIFIPCNIDGIHGGFQ